MKSTKWLIVSKAKLSQWLSSNIIWFFIPAGPLWTAPASENWTKDNFDSCLPVAAAPLLFMLLSLDFPNESNSSIDKHNQKAYQGNLRITAWTTMVEAAGRQPSKLPFVQFSDAAAIHKLPGVGFEPVISGLIVLHSTFELTTQTSKLKRYFR